MKLVIQRVSSASVRVAGEVVGEIGRGFLVLFGAETGDTDALAAEAAHKVAGLRGPEAEPLYDGFVAALRSEGVSVSTGVFGAMMSVALVNEGPATFLLELPRRGSG